MQVRPVIHAATQPRFGNSAQERQLRERLVSQLGPHLDTALRLNTMIMEGVYPKDFRSYTRESDGRKDFSDYFGKMRLAAMQNVINGIAFAVGGPTRFSD